MSVTCVLYDAAGRPGLEGLETASGKCWLCGGELQVGMPRRNFVKPTFTDHDKVAQPASEFVCPACVFSFGERSIILAERVGKEKPQRMRNYSHFVVGGEWLPLSKAHKDRMAELLLREPFPELAVVAQSGQKHLIFRARCNPPGGYHGWVQFEEQSFYLKPSVLGWFLREVEALYSGFSKKEIGEGTYVQHHILKFGWQRWHELEMVIGPSRGTPIFELALFLAQKRR